jgi:Holliday junction resolvasome RuvABC endonuclease subunit
VQPGEAAGALRVCGLDPSLTSFGGAVTCGPAVSPELFRFKTKLMGHARLDYLLGEVTSIARDCDVAVIEGVLSHMPGAEAHLNLAGLHWLVRHRLHELGVPYAVIPPSTRMKWLTGKGNAEKDDCLTTAIKRFTLADIGGNDHADALTLAAMGAAAYGQPLVPMPADRDPLLSAAKFATRGKVKVRVPVIDWPRLKTEAFSA